MGSLKVLWVVVSIALLLVGGQRLREGWGCDSEPVPISIEGIAKSKPEKKWLKVTGGELVLLESTFFMSKGSMSELFIPLVKPGEEETKQFHVIVRTKQPGLLAAAQDIQRMECPGDAKKAAAWTLENKDKLLRAMDVAGFVEPGSKASEETQRALVGMDRTRLAKDFVIVREGEEPHSGGLALLVGGIVLLLAGGAYSQGLLQPKKKPVEAATVAMQDPVMTRVPRDTPKVIEVDDDFIRETAVVTAQAKKATRKAKTKKAEPKQKVTAKKR